MAAGITSCPLLETVTVIVITSNDKVQQNRYFVNQEYRFCLTYLYGGKGTGRGRPTRRIEICRSLLMGRRGCCWSRRRAGRAGGRASAEGGLDRKSTRLNSRH